MAQNYTITQFKKGDFQDPHGNFWCDMALQGVSEPVRIVVKDPSKFTTGQEIYGSIQDATSKAGKPYLRFKREQKPDEPTYTREGDQTQTRSSGKDDEAIARAVALKAAVEMHAGKASPVEVLKDAVIYLAWLKQEQISTITHQSTPATHSEPQSGYEKAKAASEAIKHRNDEPLPEYQGMPFEGEYIEDYSE